MLKQFIFLSLSFLSGNKEQSETHTAVLQVKILSTLAVGWGYQYGAVIEQTSTGNRNDFSDIIVFGITAANSNEVLRMGDVRFISFKRTNKKARYLPAISCTIGKSNKIWLITNVDKEAANKKQ